MADEGPTVPTGPTLVVDTDPGIDDALALAWLVAAERAGRCRLRAVHTVAGNVGLDHTAANARGLLDALDRLDLPVTAGAAQPLAGAAVDASAFHGSDGLGGCATWPTMPVPSGSLADVVVAGDVVLCLGPLTNLALALDERADVADRIGRVVAMGGGFDEVNVAGCAEYNVYADPEAAAAVFASGVDLVLVPLDVTRRVQLGPDALSALERADTGSGRGLLASVLDVGIKRQRGSDGSAGMAAHDPLAALAAIDPTVITVETATVDVVLDGPERGRTKIGPTGSPIGVATAVDDTRAAAALVAGLSEAARAR